MLVLAIETSCDETSLALLTNNLLFLDKQEGQFSGKSLGQLSTEVNEVDDFLAYLNSFQVISSIISSQIQTHIKYGGVVPEIGARQHAENIHFLFLELLGKINPTDLSKNFLNSEDRKLLKKLDYIFVTVEPGLASALRVGLEFAKSLQFFIKQELGFFVEIKTVNHLDGHIASSLFNKKDKINLFPHLHLIVSGGNSQILLLESWKNKKIIGQTLDDAAGECLDKVGRMLGLPYPGGLNLAKIAKLNDSNYFNFPVSLNKDKSLNFSFSGLKTAVRYFVQKQQIAGLHFEKPLTELELADLLNFDQKNHNQKLEFIYKVCVSVQTVVVQQLFNKMKIASLENKPRSIGLSGGVSANLLLRKKLASLELELLLPDLGLTGDNAIMIALAGLGNLRIT